MNKYKSLIYGLICSVVPTAIVLLSAVYLFEFLYRSNIFTSFDNDPNTCIIPEGCPVDPGMAPGLISVLVASILVFASVALILRLFKLSWRKALSKGILSAILTAVIIAFTAVVFSNMFDGTMLAVVDVLLVYSCNAAIITVMLKNRK